MRAVLPASAVVGAMLSACSNTTSIPSRAKIVVSPSDSLEITRVRADIVDGGTVVRGHVARRALRDDPVPGYLHIEAVSGSSVIAWTNTRWDKFARRRFPGSLFQARLPDTVRPIDEIRVSHVLAGHGDLLRSGTSL